jgi:hypothetical protein
MSADTHTEVTSQSWFSRLGGAFKGILFGFVLLSLGVWLLFWNEGRSVRRARALTEGAGVVVSVPSDRVDPANEGKLVHLSGEVRTPEILRDDTFGVSVGAIHLRRSVEMYQWREHSDSSTEKKLGGGTETTTTYSYARDWSSSVINSTSFKQPDEHENPNQMPFKGLERSVTNVSLGSFRLSPGLINSMRRFEPLAIETLDALPSDLRWKARIFDGGIYIGRSPSSPEVGDLRVSFEVVRPTLVSVVAQQTGSGLGPYRASNANSIELLSLGAVAADAMFQGAQQSNRVSTWIYRLLGFLLITFGVKRFFRPLSVMADVVPAIGNLVEAVTGFVAYLLAGALTLIVVAVAWLYHRPALAITLLLLAGAALLAGGIAIVKVLKRNRQQTPSSEAAAS